MIVTVCILLVLTFLDDAQGPFNLLEILMAMYNPGLCISAQTNLSHWSTYVILSSGITWTEEPISSPNL